MKIICVYIVKLMKGTIALISLKTMNNKEHDKIVLPHPAIAVEG